MCRRHIRFGEGGRHGDHYSDRIVTPRNIHHSADRYEFDPAGLARFLIERRRTLGLSTRELAARAGISQAYVVALERSRHAANGPSPTVEVVTALADALGVAPTALFETAVRPLGRHVLLITEDRLRSPLDHARRVVGDIGGIGGGRIVGGVDSWIWAGAPQTAPLPGTVDAADPSGVHTISLRSTASEVYEPSAITRSLGAHLQALGPEIAGRNLGLVFAETSTVMSTLDDPDTIISFEHDWARLVAEAATAAGARAAWNICVYEIDALLGLPDPLDATVDLMRSHDTIWTARRHQLADGTPAAKRILDRLRPSTIGRSGWRTITDGIIEELGLAA